MKVHRHCVDRGARTRNGGFPRTRYNFMHSVILAPKTSLSKAVLYTVQYVACYLGTCSVLLHPQLPTREAQGHPTAFISTHYYPTGLKTWPANS